MALVNGTLLSIMACIYLIVKAMRYFIIVDHMESEGSVCLPVMLFGGYSFHLKFPTIIVEILELTSRRWLHILHPMRKFL